MGRRWTEVEDEILRGYYPTEGSAVHTRLPDPGRGPKDCVLRARFLGLSCEKRCARWTEVEDEILRANYPLGGTDAVIGLVSRSRAAITKRAMVLGLSAPHSGGGEASLRTWTAEEESILRQNADKCATELIDLLPGRSVTAIDIKRSRLGLTTASEAWSKEEIDLLRQFYAAEGKKVAARFPNRTVTAVLHRAAQLGIMTDVGAKVEWTAEEDAILREYWASEGDEVIKRLPNRSVFACASRASILGLRSVRRQRKPFRAWTAEEDAILRKYWPIAGIACYTRFENRSVDACRMRAYALGLK